MNDTSAPRHHLGTAPANEAAQALFDDDMATHGFVMNASLLWAHQPGLHHDLFELVGASAAAAGLSVRQRGILVTATASTRRDPYCSLAWGARLAAHSSGALAGSVLTGSDEGLDDGERALATWARAVASEPNGTVAGDLSALRAAGYDDAQILAITLFVSLRMAFSTVNGALGARPDQGLVDHAPAEVAAAVDFGRPPLA